MANPFKVILDFLKKIFPVAGAVVQLAAAGSGNPVLVAIASAIVTAQATAEAVGQAQNGEGKLAAVLPLGKAAIMQLEFVKGQEIADEDRFDGAVRKIVEGVLDLLKSFKKP